MKKVLLVLLVLLVVAGGVSAQVWTTNAPANFRLRLPKNEYSPGYQGVVNAAFLFNGQQVKAGETYELEITFKSNRAVSSLKIVMVDGSEAVSYWSELSEYMEIQNIPANTDVSQKITFVTTKGASSAQTRANQIVFDSQSATSSIDLTFSKFTFRRMQ